MALLSLPGGAASGNFAAPGFGLLAYGSAVGFGCCDGAFCAWVPRRVMPNAAQTATGNNKRLTSASFNTVSHCRRICTFTLVVATVNPAARCGSQSRCSSISG